MNKISYLTGILFAGITIVGCGSNDASKDTGSNNENVTIGLDIGDKAPEIAQQSPGGETIALSDLEGKMVLIDFWAAWCPPCRMENPNLVSAYQKYKDENFNNGEGFTIYSVSLDDNKDAWLKAIQSDNLSWNYHVSDLKGWQSVPAAKYQVRGIPASFLINGDGVILAKNLRGEALHDKLDALKQ